MLEKAKSPAFIKTMVVISLILFALGIIFTIFGGMGIFDNSLGDRARMGAMRMVQGGCVVAAISWRSFAKYRGLMKPQLVQSGQNNPPKA